MAPVLKVDFENSNARPSVNSRINSLNQRLGHYRKLSVRRLCRLQAAVELSEMTEIR